MTSNSVFLKFPQENDSTPSPPDPMIDNSEVHIVDLQQYTPLGGVFYFDAFHIPPQSHMVKGWEMREVHFKMIYISEIRKMCINIVCLSSC